MAIDKIFQEGQVPEVIQMVKDHGFVVFEKDHNYDLNIIGIRNPSPKAGSFDDLLFVIYKIDGVWIQHKYKCTTDPSLYWLKNPSRIKGTAIMVDPQQCRSVYSLDLHSGKYLALCQRNGSVKVWRDANRNQILDRTGKKYEGHGINIHRASSSRILENVGLYSAGCTVIQDFKDFEEFIDLCKKQIASLNYQKFSYTLIKDKRFFGEKKDGTIDY